MNPAHEIRDGHEVLEFFDAFTLTRYEKLAYLNLLINGAQTYKGLVRNSSIPYGKVYGVMHALDVIWRQSKQGFEKMMGDQFGGVVDVIVHGDTHIEAVESFEGVLLVNPGSPTLPHQIPGKLGTVGLLDITDENIQARIIKLR